LIAWLIVVAVILAAPEGALINVVAMLALWFNRHLHEEQALRERDEDWRRAQ
jgi:hypothetical protein